MRKRRDYKSLHKRIEEINYQEELENSRRLEMANTPSKEKFEARNKTLRMAASFAIALCQAEIDIDTALVTGKYHGFPKRYEKKVFQTGWNILSSCKAPDLDQQNQSYEYSGVLLSEGGDLFPYYGTSEGPTSASFLMFYVRRDEKILTANPREDHFKVAGDYYGTVTDDQIQSGLNALMYIKSVPKPDIFNK